MTHFAGLFLDRPRIMGIVNVTPDSFADAGETFDHEAAIERGRQQIEDGADIIDVGGESTRPGATPVDPEEECRRVLPVVTALAEAGAIVSIDTRNAGTMEQAVGAGAAIVNDVTALTYDPKSLEVAAGSGASVVLMHMRGTPETMTRQSGYYDVVAKVFRYLETRIQACREAGIPMNRLAIDPGIGFAKTASQNFEVLDRLAEFAALTCPLLIGVSRKFGLDKPPHERLEHSLPLAIRAIEQGADIVRVHDVADTRRAIDVWLEGRNELK